MENFEVLIVILLVLLGLLAIAERFKLPYSVLLVVSGLGIAFIPSIPSVVLDPEIVFFILLPPILYDAASNTSWRDFKSEAVPISTLAIALVFFTTVCVAVTAHFLIPDFPWPLAFVLGAIVSPPDAVATTSITKYLGLNRRVTTVLEGESLVNDASALIAYRLSISAIGTGTFVFWQAGGNFLYVICGGVLSGMAIGYVVIIIQRMIISNSIISTALTLLTPFIAYLVAERIHASGVLSVVTTGLMMSWRASEIYSYQTRIRKKAVWDTIIFLLNGFVFILIGLQLRHILDDLDQYSSRQLLTYGIVVSVVTIIVRILWVFVTAFSPFAKNILDKRHDTWKNVMIVAWTGTRGIVSLAAALALPLTLADGTAFPYRSLILFIAFVVIFTTLVVQGLSLPWLIRILGVKNTHKEEDENHELRLLMASHVVNFINEDFPYEINNDVKSRLKSRYLDLIEAASREKPSDEPSIDENVERLSQIQKARLEVQKFERTLLKQFHHDSLFNQSTIRRIEQELDLTEFQLSSLKKR